jgi:hypothetical protein
MTVAGRVGLVPNYPSKIPGTVLQLDAATLSASPVSSWAYAADTGPATGVFTQATSAKQPTWTAASANTNGMPSVIYDGTKVMATPNTTALQLGQDLTIATILYGSVGFSSSTIVSKTTEFDSYIPSVNASIVRNGAIGRTNGLYVANVLFSLIQVISSGMFSVFYNGVYVSGGNVAGSAAASANAVQIGQRADVLTTLTGEQPELVIVSRALAVSEIVTLHAFWAAKYKLPV